MHKGGLRFYILVNILETQNTESICVEIAVKKRKGEFYLPSDLPVIKEITQSAIQLLSKLDNLILAGGFNKDTGSKGCNKFKQFAVFCDTIDLTDLVNVKTYFKSTTSHCFFGRFFNK